MGSVVWSGGADFGGSFSAGGISLNVLTIPSGQVSGSEAGLLFIAACTYAPGTLESPGNGHVSFVDANGTVSDFGNFGNVDGGPATRPPLDLVVLENAQNPSMAPLSSLALGGHLRWTDTLLGAETVTGSVVALLWDGSYTMTNSFAGFGHNSAAGSSSSLSSPQTGDAATGAPAGLYVDGLFGAFAGFGGSPAPDFTGATDWSNVVTRVNGSLSIGLANWSGPAPVLQGIPATGYPSGVVPFSVAFASGSAAQYNLFRLEVDAPAASVGRSFATIIGDD